MDGVLTPAQLLEILEGNRRLTVRVIDAFPEEQLFSFKPTEPLRPMSDLAKEILHIEHAYIKGIATGEWVYAPSYQGVTTKADLLKACEEVRAETRNLWPKVTTERLLHSEKDGFWLDVAQPNIDRLVYALENEIHHRGQGYIYLRLLGIEPPAFYER